MIRKTNILTPLGEMVAGATDEGICLLEFTDRKILQNEYEDLKNLLNTTIEEGSNKHIKALQKQLKEYFEGKRKEFTVPLVITGSPFQKSVWTELLKIDFGSTRSYLEQATALKNPESIRAVASANGMNRIAIVIPCHRVIGSNGKLIGYGGGLHRKKWLLDHEKKYSGQAVDLSLF
jgi:AraC family transcriptional regulator, regulatory protein of adaptative response / methylated-DNA-[protein]-cysteine methyltransferase